MMGLVRSKQYVENVTINDVLLGQPTIGNSDGTPFQPGDDMSNLWFLWDDSRIPTGELVDGEVVPDTNDII
jgi:hypothetical protein